MGAVSPGQEAEVAPDSGQGLTSQGKSGFVFGVLASSLIYRYDMASPGESCFDARRHGERAGGAKGSLPVHIPSV
jgi:hypothetical protein